MQAIKELEFGELEEPLREYLDQVCTKALRSKLSFLYVLFYASVGRLILRPSLFCFQTLALAQQR